MDNELRRRLLGLADPAEVAVAYSRPTKNYTIGRDPERNTIVLPDKSVSRAHALLEVRPGPVYRIVDRNLSNRTRLYRGSEPVLAADYALTKDDILEIGCIKTSISALLMMYDGDQEDATLVKIPPTRSKIFISYRRNEASHLAGRVHDRLRHEFSPSDLVLDVTDFPKGESFLTHIHSFLEKSAVVLALVGPNWKNHLPRNRSFLGRVLDTPPQDYVIKELEIAFEADVPILPVLFDGAAMPSDADLPNGLAGLTQCNAETIRSAGHFHEDMTRIIKTINQYRPADTDPRDNRS